jgi:organic radical activating enzyme
MLQVNEIFHSFQGEGTNIGKPSIFIRLAGCNLECVWCDTKYTWLYSEKTLEKIKNKVPQNLHPILGRVVYDKNRETKKKSVQELLEYVQEYPSKHIVLTGGEPLLQKKEMILLVNEFLTREYTIEVETNGTISPSGLSDKIQFNVSPKLSNSFNSNERQFKPEVLRTFKQFNSIFKFVISSPSDLNEVEQIMVSIDLPREKVYLMSEAQTKEELTQRGNWLIELCKEKKFNYTNRLHIQMHGNMRGV